MPNGGVPINLELWEEPMGIGSLVWHQHAGNLTVRRVASMDPVEVDVVGSLAIQREFLRVMVAWLLDQNVAETSATLDESGSALSARFDSGVFTVASYEETLLTLSGSTLRHLAAFMAYWVDHDAEVVPAGLRVEYPKLTTDATGRRWVMNHVF